MNKELSEMSLEELWKLFPIVLEEYNCDYKGWFILEKGDISFVVGYHNIRRISHIGSTAVPGLIAKPTIDILLEIQFGSDVQQVKNDLIAAGWQFMSSNDEDGIDLCFNKGYTKDGFADKVFHLHVRYPGDWNELYFRDYLRRNEDVALQYGELKKRLKDRFRNNRDEYTRAKTDFVLKYTELARREMPGKYALTHERVMCV